MVEQSTKIKVADTVLLIIDVINGCCHEKCEMKDRNITFNKIRDMIPLLENFVKRYKNAGGKVVYVNCTPWKEEFLPDNINELYKDPFCRYYSKDTTGFSEGFYTLKPGKDDFIVTKNTYDAFTSSELSLILKNLHPKRILVSGVFGDGCVSATIQGGFSKGYDFFILEDLIETTDLGVRQDIQTLLKNYTWPVMYGRTIESSEFFSYFESN